MQQFKVGDHVIVDEGDEANHGLVVGIDAKIVRINLGFGWVVVQGISKNSGDRVEQIIKARTLIKVDDLVTYPELKAGDRAIVVGNSDRPSGIIHFIEVGTDVAIIGGPNINDGRVLYDVEGVSSRGDYATAQSIAACDLEPEPTHSRRSWWVDYAPADYKAERAIDYTLTPAATVALDDNLVRRYLALHGATELLGTSRDIDELTAVADWLLAS